MDIWQAARRELDGLPDGGGLNIAYEAVDRHVVHGDGHRIAFRFLNRNDGVRDVSYAELAGLTNRFANALEGLNVQRGDVVCSLAGRIPELYIAALGALKVGALFCPLFSVFGPEPIRSRLGKGRARVLVTTRALYERKVAGLWPALPDLEHVIIVGDDTPDTLSFERLMESAADRYVIPPTDPEDPAFLHFTSGTTGSPKGAVHVHAAVVAHQATGRLVLGLRPGDVYWCTADPGWVTGVSYGIVAPLVLGATSIIDEREFDAARWYGVLQDQRIAVWYTAPTAIRMLMKAGLGLVRAHDFSALRVLASVGEALNPDAVDWGREAFGKPFLDTWWQTETGAIMIANVPGAEVCPGSMGFPLPGIDAALARRTGPDAAEIIPATSVEGELALKAGWPSMFRAYLGEEERYRKCFVGGYYLTGDLARRDAEGRFWFVGRRDDVIKTAGHLVGPFEIESVLLEHPAVAEAGVIGKPDPVAGETIKAFIALKKGIVADEDLRLELLSFARKRLGPAVAPREIAFQGDLPKTRSGKIMRRLLKARELALPDGDTSSLEIDSDNAAC